MKTALPWHLAALGLAWAGLCGSVWAVEQVSVTSGGISPHLGSNSPSVSGDGRFMVFASSAKLSPEDVNSQVDVYVRDRLTKTTRLVSDSRGGDQPMISANGRFVVYRGLDEFPRVRYVDLQSTEPPITESYIFNGSGSDRFGDLGSVTPDGKYVLFAFRPTPFGVSDTKLCVVDATAAPNNRLNAGFAITNDLNLKTLGRSVMTRDGNVFFFETRDGVASRDNGAGTQDIYKMDRNGNFLRISATEGNPDESGLTEKDSVHDLSLSSDGQAIFFISERKLRNDDPSPGATIYRSTSADGFQTPVPIATPGVTPLALSAQATGNGQYLVFLGRSARGAQIDYILRISDSKLLALAPATGAPALSANNALVAFATPLPLSPQDQNGLSDVFIVDNPFPGAAALQAPNVTLTTSQNGVIPAGTAVSLSASATSSNNGFFYTAIEVDGVPVARVNNSGTIAAQNYTLTRGPHTIRAVSVDGENVPGQSSEAHVTVEAPLNNVVFRGITDLVRRGDAAGGPVSFSATAHLDNTFATPRGPVQLVITEAPSDAMWEFFGNDVNAVVRDEHVLAVFDFASIPGNTVIDQAFDAVTESPEVLGGQHFRGVGWTITATLREQVNGTWNKRDSVNLFALRPRLAEDTPGPNGGIPVLGTIAADGNFNPALLQGVAIQGPAALAAGTSNVYTAAAVFSPGGNKPCTPAWSVQASGVPASVSPNGRLSVGGVISQQTITLKAVFGNKSASRSIVVKPVSPVVSARLVAPLLDENGGTGGFRVLRTPVVNAPLTVNYSISGTAQPNVDYQALSGSVVIPPGKGAVVLPVTPINDNQSEGRETVVLTLLPSPDYRLPRNKVTTLSIEDDEPVLKDQPDLTIQHGSQIVGKGVFGFTSADQQLAVATGRGTPVRFTLNFINPTSADELFRITGAGDFLGFSVRYFDRGTDVTSDVVAGAYTVTGIPPGGSISLQLRITPTAATPLFGVMECPVYVETNDGRNDTAEAVVKRVR